MNNHKKNNRKNRSNKNIKKLNNIIFKRDRIARLCNVALATEGKYLEDYQKTEHDRALRDLNREKWERYAEASELADMIKRRLRKWDDMYYTFKLLKV